MCDGGGVGECDPGHCYPFRLLSSVPRVLTLRMAPTRQNLAVMASRRVPAGIPWMMTECLGYGRNPPGAAGGGVPALRRGWPLSSGPVVLAV